MLNDSARWLAVCCCVILGACSTSPPKRAEPASSIDAIFDEVFTHYRLPGLAIGVVRDGNVIYRRTAGELVAGSKQPITPDSLFKIASNSKAMTTALLARLVDQGKLRWDDPVTRYLPHFRMSDDWITQAIQVRDLLIHNSGLREGAGDLMLWPEPNSFTRGDILKGLAHLRPERSFRSQYAYDNLLYVVAGEVAAAAGGASYETLIRRELFEPLGMTRCQSGEFDRDAIGDVAQPHTRMRDENVVIRGDEAVVPTTTSAAAGGIRCSLNDMLTWLRLWLDAQLLDANGRRWLSDEQRRMLWSAHMPMPVGTRQRRWDGSHVNAYGYGWRLSDVDGIWRIAHTGTLAGMYSAVTLLPDKKIGFVFMINGEGSEARAMLNQLLTKHFTAPHDPRRFGDYLADLAAEATLSGSATPPTPERAAARPDELAQQLGMYEDPWFGRIELCAVNERVEFRALKSPLLAGPVMRADTRWLVDWTDPSVDAEPWLSFELESGVWHLRLTKVDPDADFSYDYEDLHFVRSGTCP